MTPCHQVASLVASRPRVKANAAQVVSSDCARLTVSGTGFHSSNTTKNVFMFSNNTGALARGLADKSTRTQLELRFTHLAPTNQGALNVSIWLGNLWLQGANGSMSLACHPSAPSASYYDSSDLMKCFDKHTRFPARRAIARRAISVWQDGIPCQALVLCTPAGPSSTHGSYVGAFAVKLVPLHYY